MSEKLFFVILLGVGAFFVWRWYEDSKYESEAQKLTMQHNPISNFGAVLE